MHKFFLTQVTRFLCKGHECRVLYTEQSICTHMHYRLWSHRAARTLGGKPYAHCEIPTLVQMPCRPSIGNLLRCLASQGDCPFDSVSIVTKGYWGKWSLLRACSCVCMLRVEDNSECHPQAHDPPSLSFRAHQSGRAGWSGSPRDSFVCTSPAMGLRGTLSCPLV